MQYVKIDRIFNSVSRAFKNFDFSEKDIIEYVGEAMGHLNVTTALENNVCFLEVNNFEATYPAETEYILQIARNNMWCKELKEKIALEICEVKEAPIKANCNEITPGVPVDCQGKLGEHEVAYYRPFQRVPIGYSNWTGSRLYKEAFSPVRLANHSFFNGVICKENEYDSIYSSCTDEYTIVNNVGRKLRFSFPEGQVAISYFSSPVDEETGYPLIPDDVSFITAITYYIKWKIAESLFWEGKEGFSQQVSYNEQRWLKYVAQANNKAFMPSIDVLENISTEVHKFNRQFDQHNRFFGNLGR